MGWSADRAWWSAALLHLEPLLVVAVLFATYLALMAGRRARGFAIAGGGLAGFSLMGLPATVSPATPPAPEWAAPVAACAGGMRAPVDDFRLLQWTLDADTSGEEVRRLVSMLAPGVTVLHGVRDARLVRAIASENGAEPLWISQGETGLAILTTGVFHLCRDADLWGDAQDDPYGAALVFVGVTPDTTFPLVVGRLPGPGQPLAWGARMEEAQGGLAALLGALQVPTAIVAADASAPWSYRWLDGRMVALGLRPLRVPPSWPAHLGPLPALPLHPYDRLWAGPAWTTTSSRRVAARTGARAPILTELTPAVRQAR